MFKTIKKKIGLLFILFLLGIPFVIHCLFKIKSPNSFFVAEWSAGEFLSYYGSILSFGATVILSALALWQNEIIRDESNKHTILLEQMEINKCCPFFKVLCLKEDYMHSNIIIKISNISDNIALNIRILQIQESFNSKKYFDKSFEILNSNDSIEVALENGFMESKDIIQMEIQCNNILGNKVFFNVQGKYSNKNEMFEFNVFKINKATEYNLL